MKIQYEVGDWVESLIMIDGEEGHVFQVLEVRKQGLVLTNSWHKNHGTTRYLGKRQIAPLTSTVREAKWSQL